MLFGFDSIIERYMEELGIKYLRRGDKAWVQPWDIAGEFVAVSVLQGEETVLIIAPVVLGNEVRLSSDAVRQLLGRNGRCHLGRYALFDGVGLFFQADVLLEGLTREQFLFLNMAVVEELRRNSGDVRKLVGGESPGRLF